MRILVLALSFVFVTHAFAANETSVSETPSWTKNLYSGLFTNYHGATLANPDSARGLDRNGKLSKLPTVNFDSEFSAGYRVSDRVSVGVVAPFFVYPTRGSNFSLGDVGVKVSHRTVVTENFHLSSNLTLQPPTSEYSRAKQIKLGIKATPSMRYDFDAVPVALGAWTEVKEYLGASDKNLKLWALPYAEYRLNRQLALNVGYEMQWYHYTGRPAGKITPYTFDFQPGVVWKPTRTVLLNPYLMIFPKTKLNADNVGVGLIASAVLL